MAPKKKKTKGNKKSKGGGIGDNVDPAEKNFILQAEIEAIQMRLVMQTEISNRKVASERELREKDKQLQQTVEDEKKRTYDIVADMTRQYKATQDELVNQEAQL